MSWQTYFTGKVVVLTGAAGGLGREMALRLSHTNPRALLLMDRDSQKLAAVGQQCRKNCQLVIDVCADVTRADEIAQAYEKLTDALGHAEAEYIVVANAGVGALNPGYDFSAELDRRVFEINYFGMLNTFTPFLPSMINQKAGHLVGVSSMAAFRGMPNGSSYSASKAAQKTLLESFRFDLEPRGIAVSCLHPGFLETPMADHSEFDMPFKVPIEIAATKCLRAIADRRSSYSFPFPIIFLARLQNYIPEFVSQLILRVATRNVGPKKPMILGSSKKYENL